MKDQVTVQRIQGIHPKLRAELSQMYDEMQTVLSGKYGVRFVQVFRTFPEQHKIYLQGRFGNPGPVVTEADAGHSYHNYGLAVDICLLNDKNSDGKITSEEIVWSKNTDLDNDGIIDWLEIVKIFLKYGWKWGKSWGDVPHFEKSFGYKTKDLLAKYNAKDFIPGTNYLNL